MSEKNIPNLSTTNMSTNVKSDSKKILKPTDYSNIEKFDLGVKQLRIYNELEEKGLLSERDSERRKKILNWCWNNIRMYGFQVAHRSIDGRFIANADDFKSIESHLWLAFIDCLLRYDKSKGAITTFFHPYFQAAVREYIGNRWSNLSGYDAANTRLVRAARNFFESQNIVYTPQMIAEKTGLSVNVVHNTIQIMEQTNYADIDEYYNLPSSVPSPEFEVVQRETEERIWGLLDVKLTQLEKTVFLLYVNPDGQRSRSYEEVAKATKLSIQEVKTICNKVRVRLQHDPDIIEIHKGVRHEKKVKNTSFLALNEKIDFSDIIEAFLND